MALAVPTLPAPAFAQATAACEYALAGWAATRLELAEARAALRACRREGRTACTAEQGRVQAAEQQLRLLRQYVDGYCRR